MAKTRKVQMLHYISGGRHDGRDWPAAGEPLTVPEWEAQDLFLAQLARPWPGGDEPETAAPVPEPEPAPVPEPAAGPEAEGQGEAPRPAAPKQDWVDWAVAHGAGEDEANAATKQQLMEAYGERA
jgi:hypothetical protein